ncbi:hypothetical protein [Tautonia plasticadhaerens]|uniref:Uncharacterized protein n=1 Tax=Tautonia plasticadhaerens TaxID=2527974 RepID=A0A518H786_9BACT|nr:hypothetical protein [Tautonia plasticadhaerens]QDV36616.1 hypothetical protein ElP_45440 [Tautonia plasticadhaerens]
MTTGSPLGQLADLLRRVEAKTRTQELIEELELAAEQLRITEEATRAVEDRSRQVRPARQRELELAEGDEVLLKELIRRTAQNRMLMGQEEFREAERLVEISRVEIDRRREEAQSELEEVQDALDVARIELRAALDRYHHVRRELDRLQVPANGYVEQGDRLAQLAEEHFPEFQVRAFAREVEEGTPAFAKLDRREQYSQMRIWIGRLRRFQHAGPGEEERDQLEGVFRRLVSLSKQHEPGYIEAFNRQYVADWEAYIAEARESLRQASEEARRNRELRGEEPAESDHSQAERQESRRLAEQALEHLKALLLIRHDDPKAKADRFRETLSRVVEGYGPPDEELIDVVRGYREWLTGPEFRSLRNALDRYSADEPPADGSPADEATTA